MKNLFFLTALLLMLSSNVQAQIHSTYLGGYWNNTNTWIGGIIPGAGNDVVIQGPVVQGSVSGYDILTEYCNNLLITSTGSLTNADYGGGTGTFPIVVHGNVVNNGTVSNGPNDFIKIYISGDLENNNIWMPYQTEFQTTNNHNLSLAPGKSFGSKIINAGSPSFTALTDMLFTCDYNGEGYYIRDNFYLNGQTFNVGNHSIELRRCMINKGTLTGNIEILGTFVTGWAEGYDIRDTLLFVGDITVTDTLTGNVYGGGYGIYTLKIIGNIINNGVIKDDYDTENPLNNDDLRILITGDIRNNGIWNCNYTNLIGTSAQKIYQADNRFFDSYITVSNPSGDIRAESNITITKDLNLNGATLDMDDRILNIQGWLTNGHINRAILNNGYLNNITSIDDLRITGKVTLDDNNIFDNLLVVEDTLQNNSYGGGTKHYLVQAANIVNNGVITDMDGDDKLILQCTGNIKNNNIWKNYKTVFNSSSDHQITLAPGKMFETWFEDVDSTTKITALTDIITTGSIYLGRATLDMNYHHLKLNPGKALYNGYLKNAKLKNGVLSYLTLQDSIQINGTVEISDFVDAIANITVNDTLSATFNGGGTATYYFNVFGDIENQGFIGSIYDDFLTMNIMGNIINKGVWSTYQNYQLFYPNHNINTVSCFNTSSTNWLFNGSSLSGSGSAAYTITSGGGVQTVAPNQSYDVTLQFNPASADTTATLTLSCPEIGSLNTIYLVGHKYQTIVDVDEKNNQTLPNDFILFQNYPNPFNPVTTIRYHIPKVISTEGRNLSVILKVFDILGNEVAILVNEEKPAGEYEIEFSAKGGSASGGNAYSFTSGIYFYQLKVYPANGGAGSFIETKKMILLK